ncbi:MAG: hypothetical protein F4227_00900 [Gammaproteobacteria bacterium]|nr:hypothetical protein [Gammaproteobacteria bacterium]MYF01568.1 hypothetical protein [Gammaproteobacteria bacterium]MYI77200.1 hypothetical protein [Gammaproteobacteria bacterium]
MSALNLPRWHLVRHYAIGITIGLVVGIPIYFTVSQTFLSQEVGAVNDSSSVHDNKTGVGGSDNITDKTKFFPADYELAEGDPQVAWNDLQENDQIHVGRLVELINTVNAWIARDGLGVLNEIHESVTDRELRSALFGNVIFTAAKEIGYQALFYKAQEIFSDDELRHEFLWRLANMWAPLNPVGSFATAAQIENKHVRAETLKSVAEIWAKTDIELLKKWLHTMPSVVINHAELMVMMATAEQSPTDALAYLPNVARTSYEELLITTITNHWKTRDTESALEWALNHEFTNDRIRNRTLGNVLYEIAKTDLDRALQIATSEPEDDFGRGPEAFLIAHIAAQDIDQAIEMLPRVRAGDSQNYAYEVIGRHLSREYEFDRAVELGGHITDDGSKRDFFDSILPSWAIHDPVNLFKEIPSLPTKYLRSRAAMHLVDAESYRHNVLTEQQLDEVRPYITTQDLREMVDRRSMMAALEIDSMVINPASAFPFNPNIGDQLKNYFQIQSSF